VRDLRLEKHTLCLDYLPMRAFAFFLIALLSIGDVVELRAAGPQVRPALIGNGPNALINFPLRSMLMATRRT